MKILKEGKFKIKRFECKYFECIFEADSSEYKRVCSNISPLGYAYVIECPCCHRLVYDYES